MELFIEFMFAKGPNLIKCHRGTLSLTLRETDTDGADRCVTVGFLEITKN